MILMRRIKDEPVDEDSHGTEINEENQKYVSQVADHNSNQLYQQTISKEDKKGTNVISLFELFY